MNPAKIKKILKNSGSPMCINALTDRCKLEIHHRDVVMSDEFFYCEHCGLKRHYVKRLTLRGKISVMMQDDIEETVNIDTRSNRNKLEDYSHSKSHLK